MEQKELICIGCPMGCALAITMDGGQIVEVSGNTCPKGKAYGEKEVTNPSRTITSTVRVLGGESPLVPVKTRTEIPKDKIFACMEVLHGIAVRAPVAAGDVLLEDVAGTGVPVVATRGVGKK